MGLAECDTRAAACDRAGINRVEAFKERARPGRGASWVGDARGVLGSVGGANDPAVEIGLHGGLVGDGHCVLGTK